MKYVELRLDDNFEVSKKVVREDIPVIAENDRILVLGDDDFTKLDKKKRKDYNFNSVVEEVSIWDYARDTVMKRIFGAFTLRMYTDKSLKVAEKKINREFNKFLQDKVGAYGFGREVEIKL